MTPQTIITNARYTLNDTSSVTYSDAELLAFVNDGLKEVLKKAPRWFYTVGNHACTQDAIRQTMSSSTATEVVRVIRVVGGNIVTFVELDTLDRFKPGWPSDTAGAAVNWMRDIDDPLSFYIYPKAPASQTLELLIIPVLSDYALTDSLTLPSMFHSALEDYVVFRAESKDDEHVNSGRAAAYYQSFMAKIGT